MLVGSRIEIVDPEFLLDEAVDVCVRHPSEVLLGETLDATVRDPSEAQHRSAVDTAGLGASLSRCQRLHIQR